MAKLHKIIECGIGFIEDTIDVEPKNGADFSLEELQEFVGGYIEIIDLFDGTLMVINEEGKLKDLPFNIPATLIYSKKYGMQDYIVGNALVCDKSQIL